MNFFKGKSKTKAGQESDMKDINGGLGAQHSGAEDSDWGAGGADGIGDAPTLESLIENVDESVVISPESNGDSAVDLTPESIVATASQDELMAAVAPAVASSGLGGRLKKLLGGKKAKSVSVDGSISDSHGFGESQGSNILSKPTSGFADGQDAADARMSAILSEIGSKPKALPIIGKLTPKAQYGVGVTVMTVAMIGAGTLASFGLLQSSQYQSRAEVGTQLKMLSQRLMATTQHSISGSSDAFNKLRESRSAVTVEFDKLLKGTTGLPEVDLKWNDDLNRMYKTYSTEVLPMVDKVLAMGDKLGELPTTAGILNDEATALGAAAERLLAHLIFVGAPQAQITTVHQIIDANERMRRSGVSLLTSADNGGSGDKVIEERVAEQLNEFRALFNGKWTLDGNLTLDGKSLKDQNKEVDFIADRYPGSVATILQIDGGDFMRLATSEKTEDGSRASGMRIGKSHPAYATLLFGEVYIGQAVLFGRPYITKYEPIKDETNKVIGALAVGTEVDVTRPATQILADYISSFNHLQQGLESLRDGSEALGMEALSSDTDVKILEDINDAVLHIEEVNIFLQDRAPQIIEARANVSALMIAAESALASSDRFITKMTEESKDSLQALYSALGLLTLAAAGLALIGVVNNRLNRIDAWSTAFKNKTNERDIIDFMSEILPLELGDLTVSFTNNTGAMEGITGGIRSSVSEAVISLRDAMSTVVSTTNSVMNNVSQSVAGSRDLSDSNARQAEEIQDVVGRVADLTSAIEQVTGDTNRATSMTEAAKFASDTGARVVSQTNEKMTEIRANMQDVLKSVKHLGETSHEIGTIVEAIETITDRTQVIAVNASLEAAKAGAAGHGFSVLAGEVNRLAEQSNEALRTITALVQRIQGETAQTIRAVEDSTNNVVEGARLSEAANAELTKISRLSESLQQIMKEIHRQSESQSSNAGSVRESMGRLVSLSRNFQASVEQMVHGVESIDASMGTLQSTVSIFKVENDSQDQSQEG